MLFAREAHYQPLTQICFSRDEALVFTGGEDAVVHSWRVMDLVDFNLRSEEIMPVQSWNDHTLAITGIVCGSGTAMNARLYTSSLDQTIKVTFGRSDTDLDLGCVHFILDDHDTVSESSEYIRRRRCGTGYFCRHSLVKYISIQSHTVHGRKI